MGYTINHSGGRGDQQDRRTRSRRPEARPLTARPVHLTADPCGTPLGFIRRPGVILRRVIHSRKPDRCATIAGMYSLHRPLSVVLLVLWAGAPSSVTAQSPSDFSATTEQSCSFGMAKGEASQHCQVPIPAGCLVAHIPGTTKPWTTISKGGKMTCRFDEKRTDWKTKITGNCGRCGTEHCSVQFIVRFDCTHR